MLVILYAALLFASDVLKFSDTSTVIFGVVVLASVTATIWRRLPNPPRSMDGQSIYGSSLSARLLVSAIFGVLLLHFAAEAKWETSILIIVLCVVAVIIVEVIFRIRRRRSLP
jgi:hypothetical protein